MRRRSVQRVQRLFLLAGLLCLLYIALLVGRIAGYSLPGWDDALSQGVVWALFNKQVVLISGHAGFDSGAVCTDAAGRTTLIEAEVNAQVAQLAAGRLRRAGADVKVLEEYDPRLTGLRADVLLSLHADSCIDASGYKAAFHMRTQIPVISSRLLACIDAEYPRVTGLPHHANTVTHDMTEYHAFSRIDGQTPAAILEMGFLGGDRKLLTTEAPLVAKGVADSIICFLSPDGRGGDIGSAAEQGR